VQNSNPSHTPTPVPPPLSFEDARARAYERARVRIIASEPAWRDLLGAFTTRTDQPPDDKARPLAAAEPRDDGAHANPPGGARVTLDELLPVFRDPIEWALARAERHAQGDPLNLAALDRARAAYQSRMAWIGSDGALCAARPTLRPTDVLTVAGLVIGSIDPSFAQRTSIGMRDSLLDALAEMIPIGVACAPGAAAPPAEPFCCGDHIPGASAPFGPPRVSRPVVATCCCRHGHVL
jgi:hypothetical protein